MKLSRQLSILLLSLVLGWFVLKLMDVPVRHLVAGGWQEMEQGLHAWVLSRRGQKVSDDDEAPAAVPKTTTDNGPGQEGGTSTRVGTVLMSPELQQLSGVETQALTAMHYLPEAGAYAEVLDPAPLIRLRSDWLAARADITLLESAQRLSVKELRRIRLLQQADANVSLKTLQQAEAQARADRLRVAAARIRQQGLRAVAEQHWGSALVAAILNEDDPLGQGLRQGREVLLRVVMTASERLPDKAKQVTVSQGSERDQAVPAFRISAAPRTDTLLQGETWFFHTAAGEMRIGMLLRAWIPLRSEAVAGVRLPAQAAVWYAGQPWVYLRKDDETFVRHAIGDARELGDGWFVPAGLRAGDKVVTSGAQMLLSEEFHWQIPNEDDD